MTAVRKDSAVIVDAIEAFIGEKLVNIRAAVLACAAAPTKEFTKLPKLAKSYVDAMQARIRNNSELFSPYEYCRRRAIEFAESELPLNSGRATTREIIKALLLAPGLVPSSWEIRESYKMKDSTAAALRRDVMEVLRALHEAGLYTHATLEATNKYSPLRQKRRRTR